MLGGTCYYYHPWNKNKGMETGRFSDLTRSDPTDCSWQWPRGSRQQASGQCGWQVWISGGAGVQVFWCHLSHFFLLSPFPFLFLPPSLTLFFLFSLSFLPIFPKLCKNVTSLLFIRPSVLGQSPSTRIILSPPSLSHYKKHPATRLVDDIFAHVSGQ